MDAWMAYTLIAVAFGVGFVLGRAQQTQSALPTPPPDPAVLVAIRPILETEGKIAAIKAYREKTGVGLRDGKLAVETLERTTEA